MFAVLESKAVRLGINSPLLSLWRGLSHSTSTLVHIDKNSSTQNSDRAMCVLQSVMWFLQSLKAKPWGWESTRLFYHFKEDFPIPPAHRSILKKISSNLKSGGKILKYWSEICSPGKQSREVGDQLASFLTLKRTFPFHQHIEVFWRKSHPIWNQEAKFWNIKVRFAVLESKALRYGINSPLLSLWRGLSHSNST